jgi:hypothetical protein
MTLLVGRNAAPLTDNEVQRVIYAFMALDQNVNVRHDPQRATAFRIDRDEAGTEFGEIVFGPDIYPGGNIVDPNSSLSMIAAVAHELSHYYRWRDKTQVDPLPLTHLDEALTSLEAISRYERHLSSVDVRQLSSDAIVRMKLYIQALG